MNNQQVIDITMSVIYATTELSLPLLLAALFVGLLVSIFQAATQINEATLAFLPKVAAMIVVLVVLSPWMLRRFSNFTTNLYNRIPEIVRSH
jgi:flagellar biosynthesis protein FliQ